MDDLNINSFNALYTLYYRKSFLFARSYVHDEQAAEDIAADNPEIIFAIRCTKDKDDYGWNSIGGFYANIDGVGWGELYASEPLRAAYAEYPEDLRSRYIVPQYLKDDDTGEYRKEFIYIESSEEDGVPRKYYRWNEIVEEGTPSISDYCIPASSLFTIQYPTLDSEIPGFTLWLHTSSSSVMADSR